MNLINNTAAMNQRNNISVRKISLLRTALIAGITPCFPAISWGQTNNPPIPSASQAVPEQAANLAEVVVTAETMSDSVIQGPFLPDVVGTSIFKGKKTSVIDFDAMPQIQNDNYRQAFSKTPGLLTSELSNSSLLSLSYRGIGDPHESQNMMVLKNGIPFVLDPLGYSTVYFAPPFESVDRLEFVSGGAALLYGSQPSGALNYITHVPDRSTPFKATTQHIVGSENLYSTFSTLEGGNDKFGYLLNLDHRSGDSFRRRNSDFELYGAELSLFYDINDRQKLTASFERYDSDHGEPGGRSEATYASDPNGNLLNHDRVRLDRLFGSIGYEVGDDHAKWITKAWASDVVRYSKRQTGQGFGTVTGNQLDINQHTYYTLGLDSRARIDYQLGENESTFTAGVTAMNINAPIFLERTAANDLTSDRGDTLRNKSERDSVYAAFFAENLFRLGRFTFTPSVRLEYNEQSIDEQVNVNRPLDLLDQVRNEVVPLGGIGATFDTGKDTEIYANVSSSYKPPTYADAFPLGGNETFSENLEAGHLVNSEIGYRGRPTSWSMFDASLFHINYKNRFGRVQDTTTGNFNFQNVGESVNQGFSFTSEIDFYDYFRGESELSIIWYSAYQYLDAEFTEGPVKGNTPQYAPEHMLRTGLIVQRDGKWKVAGMFTHLSDHSAIDTNNANWAIPSYTVLDITAEAQIWSGQFAGVNSTLWALCGINNALDEEYFSRVRANGIDPANDRNYYIGMRAEF